MTRRLYFDDSYQTAFDSRVTSVVEKGDRLGLVLAETAFYPDCGGQPHDLGTLNGIQVLGVEECGNDDVIHWLPGGSRLDGDRVAGRIDWARRFDFMQQHTGQHILSQAFIRTVSAETVGFHLSDTFGSTIDLDTADVTPRQLADTEALANQVVFENRPVVAAILDETAVKALPLRKPPSVSGTIRVITIPDYDWSACGGTHVARTGSVGLVKVVRLEHRGNETRVTFLCGGRTVAHFGSLQRLTDDLAREFSVAVEELPASIERLRNQAHSDRKRREEVEEQLIDVEAQTLSTGAENIGPVLVVCHTFEGRPQDDVRRLARRLVSQPGFVVFFGIVPPASNAGKPGTAQLVFARSAEVDVNMRDLLRSVHQSWGGGGGGGPDMAQGGGLPAEALPQAMEQARQALAL